MREVNLPEPKTPAPEAPPEPIGYMDDNINYFLARAQKAISDAVLCTQPTKKKQFIKQGIVDMNAALDQWVRFGGKRD